MSNYAFKLKKNPLRFCLVSSWGGSGGRKCAEKPKAWRWNTDLKKKEEKKEGINFPLMNLETKQCGLHGRYQNFLWQPQRKWISWGVFAECGGDTRRTVRHTHWIIRVCQRPSSPASVGFYMCVLGGGVTLTYGPQLSILTTVFYHTI